MQYELKVYAIYDKKGKRFDTPFFAISDVMAKRRFLLMQDEEKSPLAKWPEDFQLYELAGFDVETGKIDAKKAVMDIPKYIKEK